ncbi:MAG: aminotransferase class V-fold PLP-dependent enzyme, partial [Pseudomonadota bacterium]
MSQRIHNFNPGPAALPLPVLQEVQSELLNYQGTGMSVLEISHRSAVATAMMEDASARIRRLLRLPSNYHIVYLQ